MSEAPKPSSDTLPPGLKLARDLGPLLIFFVANKLGDVFTATAAFMAATIVAVIISWVKAKHIPPMLIFSGVVVFVFGGLTLWLHDDTFIKLKPTLIYGLCAGVLAYGMATKRSFLKLILGEALPTLDDAGWSKLTRNWTLFFVVLLLANEVARQLLSTDQWVTFKVWGVTAATLVFAMLQAPMMTKHGVKTSDD